jgi:hypothetical protein
MSRTPFNAFGPHTELTEALKEPRPSVANKVVRLLNAISKPSLLTRSLVTTHVDLPADSDSTLSLTPARPSIGDALAGTNA